MRLRIIRESREKPAEVVTLAAPPLRLVTNFQHLITAVFEDGEPGWPDGRGVPEALSRRWWENGPGPSGSTEAVWKDLEVEGMLAEVASWSECGNAAWLQMLFGRLVIDHQYQQTLMEPGDPLPAPWSTLGVQAAAAVWKIGNVAVTTANGDGLGDNSRSQVTSWLDALLQVRAGWGDLIIMHKFASVFERWGLRLQPEVRSAEMGLALAKASTKQKREQEAKAWWWKRAAAKLRTKQAEYAELTAESRLQRAQAAQAWLAEAGRKWVDADAIGKLPLFGDSQALPLPPSGTRVAGLDMWAVRKAAHLCPHTPTALVDEHAAMRTVFGKRLGLQLPADPSDPEELWRNRWLALEIYRIWFGLLPSSPNNPPLVTLLPRLSDEQLESYRKFFEPWRSLDRARRVLRGVPSFGDRGEYQAAGERVFGEIGEALDMLRVDLTQICRGPLQALDFEGWGGKRLAWFRARLDAIGVEGHSFDDKVWPRLADLAKFYRRWGELTATAREVREASPNSTPNSSLRILLLPWRRLQAAHLAARIRGTSATDQQREFLEAYAMPQWIREKLDDLWGSYGTGQTAGGGS